MGTLPCTNPHGSVRDMVMQMSGSSGVLSMPDEHLPGLIAWC